MGTARPKRRLQLGQGFFLEKHHTWVAPQQLLLTTRVLCQPGFDAGPGRVFHQPLVQQPAAHAAVRLVIGTGIGQAHPALAAIGLGHAHPARALNLQDQRIHRVRHVGDGTALEHGLRLGQGVHLLPAVPGFALGQAGRGAVQRHGEARCRHPAGLDHRFKITGQQPGGLARCRFDAVGLQAYLHPGQLLLGTANAQAAHLGAQCGPGCGGFFAAFEPGVPGFKQVVAAPAGQFGPGHRHPGATGLRQGPFHRCRGGPRRCWGRVSRHRGVDRHTATAYQRSYNQQHCHDRPITPHDTAAAGSPRGRTDICCHHLVDHVCRAHARRIAATGRRDPDASERGLIFKPFRALAQVEYAQAAPDFIAITRAPGAATKAAGCGTAAGAPHRSRPAPHPRPAPAGPARGPRGQ